MNEAGVPAFLIEPQRPAPVAGAARGHQSMQEKHRRRIRAFGGWEKFRVRDVIFWKRCFDRDWQSHDGFAWIGCAVEALSLVKWGVVRRRSIVVLRSEALAFGDIALHLLKAPAVQAMAPMHKIEQFAAKRVNASRG